MLGVLVPDYLLTILAAVLSRRPMYLLLGPLFPALRMLDAWLCLRAMAHAYLRRRTDGRWTSPSRRTVARA